MSDLFYNRDQNISGVATLTGLPFSPSYGSTVNFTTRASEVKYPNRVVRRMGQSLNSVLAEYNLTFSLRDTDAQSVINYLESRSGTLPVVLEDRSSIYQTISGFADNFSWNATSKNQNDVSVRLVVDNRSPQLNWSGMAFVNHDFQQWRTGESVPKYAIRYFAASNQSYFDNFFYCTGEHVSTFENGPFATGSMWTQNLFLDESFQFSVNTNPDVARIEFNNSFFQRIKDKKNIHSLENVTVRFNGLTDAQTKAVLHFVESKFGEIKFNYSPPKIYNRPKIFYCPSWRHTWLFKNSNNVELDLFEDPMGVLPQNNSPAITINPSASRANIYFNTSSVNGLSLVSYGGGERQTLPDGETVKDFSAPQEIKIFGPLTGFSASNQAIDSIAVSNQSPVVEINAPSCQLSQVQLNEARRIKFLNFSGNNLQEINTQNITGLRVLNVENNRISELDVSTNNGLTGLYVRGNKLSFETIQDSLDALVNFGNYSGEFLAEDGSYVDFETNDGLSGAAYNNFSTLGWRGWNMSFDNAKYPLDISGLSNPACHFKQEDIISSNGATIFTWRESVRGLDASRFDIPDSSRPTYVERAINARSVLSFNGQAYLKQTGLLAIPTTYGIFAVVKPESSGVMAVYCDYWNRGLFVSGNRLMHRTNFGTSLFGELSGGYNVVGVYTSGVVMSGAVNSQTPVSGANKAGTTNFSQPGIIGWNRFGPNGVILEPSGSLIPAPFIGHISEVLLTTGSVNFETIMRDLGAKHGIEIT